MARILLGNYARKKKTSSELHNVKERQHRTLNSSVSQSVQTFQCRADVCAAPKSCVDGKGLKRLRAKYRTLKMKGRDVQKTKQNSNLKTKRKSKAATPCDCRASVSNPAAQPTVQTLNCLVVVLLLTTDSMTLENKEGGPFC